MTDVASVQVQDLSVPSLRWDRWMHDVLYPEPWSGCLPELKQALLVALASRRQAVIESLVAWPAFSALAKELAVSSEKHAVASLDAFTAVLKVAPTPGIRVWIRPAQALSELLDFTLFEAAADRLLLALEPALSIGQQWLLRQLADAVLLEAELFRQRHTLARDADGLAEELVACLLDSAVEMANPETLQAQLSDFLKRQSKRSTSGPAVAQAHFVLDFLQVVVRQAGLSRRGTLVLLLRMGQMLEARSGQVGHVFSLACEALHQALPQLTALAEFLDEGALYFPSEAMAELEWVALLAVFSAAAPDALAFETLARVEIPKLEPAQLAVYADAGRRVLAFLRARHERHPVDTLATAMNAVWKLAGRHSEGRDLEGRDSLARNSLASPLAQPGLTRSVELAQLLGWDVRVQARLLRWCAGGLLADAACQGRLENCLTAVEATSLSRIMTACASMAMTVPSSARDLALKTSSGAAEAALAVRTFQRALSISGADSSGPQTSGADSPVQLAARLFLAASSVARSSCEAALALAPPYASLVGSGGIREMERDLAATVRRVAVLQCSCLESADETLFQWWSETIGGKLIHFDRAIVRGLLAGLKPALELLLPPECAKASFASMERLYLRAFALATADTPAALAELWPELWTLGHGTLADHGGRTALPSLARLREGAWLTAGVPEGCVPILDAAELAGGQAVRAELALLAVSCLRAPVSAPTMGLAPLLFAERDQLAARFAAIALVQQARASGAKMAPLLVQSQHADSSVAWLKLGAAGLQLLANDTHREQAVAELARALLPTCSGPMLPRALTTVEWMRAMATHGASLAQVLAQLNQHAAPADVSHASEADAWREWAAALVALSYWPHSALMPAPTVDALCCHSPLFSNPATARQRIDALQERLRAGMAPYPLDLDALFQGARNALRTAGVLMQQPGLAREEAGLLQQPGDAFQVMRWRLDRYARFCDLREGTPMPGDISISRTLGTPLPDVMSLGSAGQLLRAAWQLQVELQATRRLLCNLALRSAFLRDGECMPGLMRWLGAELLAIEGRETLGEVERELVRLRNELESEGIDEALAARLSELTTAFPEAMVAAACWRTFARGDNELARALARWIMQPVARVREPEGQATLRGSSQAKTFQEVAALLPSSGIAALERALRLSGLDLSSGVPS